MTQVNYLSKNLFLLRKLTGMSQAETEARTGIKRNTWSNWENGKSEPGLENLFKIAAFYNVDIGDLLSKNLSEDEEIAAQMAENQFQKVNEAEETYLCKSCLAKEEIIVLQKQTIKAMEGQVEALKIALEGYIKIDKK
ncbi:MAG TPA: helix-turn-helix transcriptional regulator [Edaphocola sp.]|nr:helix-turn-helix transcriptional regulator [Edaphocola sp.]